MKLLEITRSIIREYTEKIITQLKEKFKKENPGLSDEQILYYINRFEQIKDTLNPLQRDIFKYTFVSLERLVDSRKDNTKSQNDELKDDEDLILNKDGVKVYKGENEQKCIKYGQNYTWCISRQQGNLFYNYRLGSSGSKKTSMSFYFVFDTTLNPSDPYHAFVLYSYEDGKFGLTSSVNNPNRNLGDIVDLTWEKLLSIINPHTAEIIKNIKDKIIFIPLSDEENLVYKFKKGITDEEFANLTYAQKEMYVQLGLKLTVEMYTSLSKELKMLWINSIDFSANIRTLESAFILISEYDSNSFSLIKRIFKRSEALIINDNDNNKINLPNQVYLMLLNHNLISKEFYDNKRMTKKYSVHNFLYIHSDNITTITPEIIQWAKEKSSKFITKNNTYCVLYSDQIKHIFYEVDENVNIIAKFDLSKDKKGIVGNFSEDFLINIFKYIQIALPHDYGIKFKYIILDNNVKNYRNFLIELLNNYKNLSLNRSSFKYSIYKEVDFLFNYLYKKDLKQCKEVFPLVDKDLKDGTITNGIILSYITGKGYSTGYSINRLNDNIEDIPLFRKGIELNKKEFIKYLQKYFSLNLAKLLGYETVRKLISTKNFVKKFGIQILDKGIQILDHVLTKDNELIKLSEEKTDILGNFFDKFGWPYKKTSTFKSEATFSNYAEGIFGGVTLDKRNKELENKGKIIGAIKAKDRDILVIKLKNGEYIGWWRLSAAGDFFIYRGGKMHGSITLFPEIINKALQINPINEIQFNDLFKEEIEAFHGTPFKFNKFQVVAPKNSTLSSGWGIYFHTYHDFAKNFTQGRKSSNVYFNGYDSIDMHILTDNTVFLKIPNWVTSYEDIYDFVESMIDTYKESYEEALNNNNDDNENLLNLKYYIEEYKNFLDIIKNMEITQKQKNYVYKVLLFKGKSPNEYDLLDERKRSIDPLQFEKIVKQLKKENINISLDSRLNSNEIYSQISRYFGNQKDASLFMLRAGIDGVIKKYNGPGEGVIIFDAKNIEIQSIEEFDY